MKLAEKAYQLFKILDDTNYKIRMSKLAGINEYGFSILILWNRIEITLKLLRYYHVIPVFPDQLDFIDKRWPLINNVFKVNADNYNLILERNNSKSLWKIRDKIAHASYEINITEFKKYKTAADQILALLSDNLLPLNDYKAKRNKQKE